MMTVPGTGRAAPRDGRGDVEIEYATAVTIGLSGLKPPRQDAVTPVTRNGVEHYGFRS